MPESRELVREGLQKSAVSGEEFTNEYVFSGIPGDSDMTYLRATMRVIAKTGNRMLVYCTSENLTAQHTAQRDLLDNLPGGAGIYEYKNNTLTVVYLNKSFWRLIGQEMPTGSEMLGESPIHPEDMPIVAHELSDAVAQQHDLICDIRLSYRKTEYRRVHLVGRIVVQEDGVRIYVTFTPIETAAASAVTVSDNKVIRERWEHLLLNRDPRTYMLFRSNISKNSVFDSVTGTLLPAAYPDTLATFDEQVAHYTSHLVHPDDRVWYAARLRSDVLLAKFYGGVRNDAFEYRELIPSGGYRWLKCTMEFLEYPDSTDVEAYLLYENINEAKQTELQMKAQAQTEPLTGLLNRKAFVEKFVAVTKTYKAERSALFIIDLDGFKQVNDSFGHAVGDETLIEIANKLRRAFRPKDFICRLSGDEFLVGMTEITQTGMIVDRAALVCAMLHKSFSVDIQLSASIGISVFPDNGKDFDTLYRKADAALYHVKGKGKDGYALYSDEMKDEMLLPESAIVRETPPGRTDGAAPKRRMLIVDDNELNRDLLVGLFDEEFIVDTAEEGTAALTRLRRYGSGISVVLLDLMMPGMNGFEVLDRMREDHIMQSIPVIVVSGADERKSNLEAVRRGASDFVTKPVDPDVLKVRVASALSRVENERLRAQNRYLTMQNDEARRLAEAKRHTEELTVALHAAERADIAKTQFLSGMSHEIRTPLNAVIGYNTLARSEMTEAKTDAERRQAEMKVMDCLIKSEVASRHLLSIINDVLDMFAIESGKMKVEHSAFDFKGMITALTVMFFSQARAKGVGFEVLFDKPVDEWFIGDQLRINQILTNLLSNAVKFTPEGGNVSLTVTVAAADNNKTAFRFIVADTGIGMTQEYLEHIWTPFEQAEASISRRFGGTGLGLSITKNLVELMGGTISVESESGVGSRFYVDLTLERTEQPERKTERDFSGVNALVVDDDAGTCDYIKLLFDRCGACCTTFTSGADAVKSFSETQKTDKPYNLCLIDWRMPDMDGFATISALRRIAGKTLPIIVVTAYDFSEVSGHTEALAINKFVSKPLFQSSLFDLLANINGRSEKAAYGWKQKFDFDGARVLLVEDNNMNMEVARRILTAANLAVDSAWNGQEAVDIFNASKAGTYKAILMDIHMPVVDGYQATRMIRASGHGDAGTIPIIAMTADAFAEDITEAQSSGMNDHLSKPVDVESLYHKLAQYIKATLHN